MIFASILLIEYSVSENRYRKIAMHQPCSFAYQSAKHHNQAAGKNSVYCFLLIQKRYPSRPRYLRPLTLTTSVVCFVLQIPGLAAMCSFETSLLLPVCAIITPFSLLKVFVMCFAAFLPVLYSNTYCKFSASVV